MVANRMCPSDDLLEGFLSGRLTESERERLEAHLDACETCADTISILAQEQWSTERESHDDDPLADTISATLARDARFGRYVVLDLLGMGGMGVVHAAYDPELDRKVALKVLRESHARSGEAKARMLGEARALARLSHPNVVTVHDVGLFGDQVFLAMEFVRGRSLGRWVEEEAPSAERILEAFAEAGRGLAAAHAAGLVHRDFKPANVMLGDDGRVRVTDFGLARVPRAEGERGADPASVASSTTEAGTVLGTPAYMPPEQLAGGTADARSDQFAFCVSLFEALHGRRPFAGESTAELADAIRAGPVFPARAPAAAARVNALLRRGLAAEPGDRYPDMHALVEDLADDTRGAWRHRLAIGAAVVAAVGLAVAARTARPACAEVVREELAGVWDAPTKEVIERDVRGGPAERGVLWRSLEARLDGYAREWSTRRARTCTELRKDDARGRAETVAQQRCLDRRLAELRAVSKFLASGSSVVRAHALDAAEELPSLRMCEAPSPVPGGALDEAAYQQLNAIKLLDRTGRYQEALRIADAVIADGKTPAQLLAEAHLRRGHLLTRVGRLDEARDAMQRAVAEADATADDETRARALIALVFVLALRSPPYGAADLAAEEAAAVVRRFEGEEGLHLRLTTTTAVLRFAEGRRAEAERSLREVLARVEQLPEERLLELTVLNHLAIVLLGGGRPDEALAFGRRAQRLSAELWDPRHPGFAVVLKNVAAPLAELGKYDEARELLERALRLHEETVGADNARAVSLLCDLADLELRTGRPARAAELAERARTIAATRVATDDHRRRLRPTLTLAEARIALADPKAATALLDEVLARYQSVLGSHERAEVDFALARATWLEGGARRPSARALAQEARARYASGDPATAKVDEVDAWLREVGSSGAR